jgi:hypothetical protein
MTTETTQAVGRYLVQLLDAAEPTTGEALALAGSLAQQRESARRWAVHYEQAAAEYGRRVQIALAFVAEMRCVCQPPHPDMHEARARGDPER